MHIPTITQAWVVEGLGGWYCDDKRAIVAGARRDGYVYDGAPSTPGFRAIREPGEALLVTLEAEDGSIGEGDCVSVTYAGGGGRAGPFRAREYQEIVSEQVLPGMMGRSWASFREAAVDLDASLSESARHPAVPYGISQALLSLAASAQGCTIAEVVCSEHGLPLPSGPVPAAVQTGEMRHTGADKAILKRADLLPHGLIVTEDDVGPRGERLLRYARWLRRRIRRLSDGDYEPVIHFDVYGTVGRALGNDVRQVADFILELEQTVQPYALQLESPFEMESRESQIEKMAQLRSRLRKVGAKTRIVADEWCNTFADIQAFVNEGACDIVQIKIPDLGNLIHAVDAVLYCKSKEAGAYLGGSCNETSLSAQISTEIALATGADQMLAKPGMGVDEALMIVRNRMARVLSRIGHIDQG
jgi:methylaspartate ammonia-lyase